ncbi:MAG: hypothetical protein ACRD1Q_16105 [Vicinamibacterales bacterium]
MAVLWHRQRATVAEVAGRMAAPETLVRREVPIRFHGSRRSCRQVELTIPATWPVPFAED